MTSTAKAGIESGITEVSREFEHVDLSGKTTAAHRDDFYTGEFKAQLFDGWMKSLPGMYISRKTIYAPRGRNHGGEYLPFINDGVMASNSRGGRSLSHVNTT